mgnify:CR=1 FL=1|jgi:hypothetical protein
MVKEGGGCAVGGREVFGVVPGCAAMEVTVFGRGGLVFSRMGVGKRASWYWCYG